MVLVEGRLSVDAKTGGPASGRLRMVLHGPLMRSWAGIVKFLSAKTEGAGGAGATDEDMENAPSEEIPF